MSAVRSTFSTLLPGPWRAAMGSVMLLLAVPANSEPIVFTNQTEYLNALAANGYVWIREGFEDDAVWGQARSPASIASLTQFGVEWSANNGASKLSTSGGAALEGNWGVYSLPHGSYTTGTGCATPGACGDGLIGVASEPFRGVAAWVRGMYGSKVAVFLNGDLGTPVGFPEVCDSSGENCVDYGLLLESGYKFFGLIEPNGFSSFEFREMEGVVSDVKYLWFDDFTVAFTNVPPPQIAGVGVISNGITLNVRNLAVNGQYRLERSLSLATNTWTVVGMFTAEGSETNLSETIGTDTGQRFYRLRSP